MTSIDELAELRQQVQSLLDANSELHGDYLAAVNLCRKVQEERDELRAIVENIPEGCTPADARMLREANHGLIDENAQLRARVAECEQALVNAAAWLEADTNEIARDILSGLCDSNDIYESTAHCIEKIIAPVLANQIEGGE